MARAAKPAPAPAQLWPADHVERRPVAALVPYARNARTHSQAQVAQLAASIREWGWTVPVLVDEAGTLIAGHGRVLAAQLLGLADIPVMVARGWTEAQRRAYVVADNKLALNAGWDDAMLRVELADLQSAGFDLSVTGFGAVDLAALMGRGDGLTDPDEAPEPPAEPVSRAGDVWICGRHRIVCDDATDPAAVAKALGKVVPHLMVTDPPYGVDYDPAWRNRIGVNKSAKKSGRVLNDDKADWREAWLLFPGNIAYVWHAGLFSSTVATSLEACGFKLRSQIIWAKDRFALSRGDYHWHHEPCWYAVKGAGQWSGDRKQSTLWQINARDDNGHGHGTQKPVECMRRPIENNSSPGQAVYDPFLGSGTTVIAAEITGRACHGIELSPAYVDVAVLRWQDFTGKAAILEATGKTLEATKAGRAPKPPSSPRSRAASTPEAPKRGSAAAPPPSA